MGGDHRVLDGSSVQWFRNFRFVVWWYGGAAVIWPSDDAVDRLKKRVVVRFFVVVLLGVGLASVFVPHLDNGFVYDDHPQIENNPWVTSGGPWLKPFQSDVWENLDGSRSSHAGYYRPLFTLMNRLLYHLGDGMPMSFHAASLGLHAASVCLVVLLMAVLGFDRWTAIAAACLFAFHPLVGDVVFWAGCLSEQLMLVGFLSAFALMLVARRYSGWKRTALGASSLACAIAALFSKETALVIAPILALEAVTGPRETRRRHLLETAPMWAASALFLALRALVLKSSGLGGLYPDTWWSLSRAGEVLLWDLRRLAFPFPLTLFHEPPVRWDTAVGTFSGSAAILGLLGLGVWVLMKRHRWSFWMAWVVLPLLPPLTQLFFVQQTGLIVADRYLLMSLVPWCVVLVRAGVAVLERVFAPRRVVRIGAVVLAGACFLGGLVLADYGSAFQDDESLFLQASQISPDHPIVLAWLAELQMKQGRYDTAVRLLRRAIDVEPGRLNHHLNLGISYSRLGRRDDAIVAFQSALKVDDTVADPHLLLADALRDSGRVPDAVRHYEFALGLDPSSVAARVNLGTARYLDGDVAAAIGFWESALSDSPDNTDLLFNLGMAYRALSDFERSAAHLRRFLSKSGDSYRAQRESAKRWLVEMSGRS
jgi:tetratricopeptide (TPR) repeat protein